MGFVQVVNVLLAQILELQGDFAKIITKLGFITTKRLSKLKKNQIFYLIIQEKKGFPFSWGCNYLSLQNGFRSTDYETLFPDFSKFSFFLLLIIMNSK